MDRTPVGLAAKLPLVAQRVDALAGVLLQLLHRCRIQVQQVCQLREIDTFGAGHLFVGAQHRERQHVQRGAAAPDR